MICHPISKILVSAILYFCVAFLFLPYLTLIPLLHIEDSLISVTDFTPAYLYAH